MRNLILMLAALIVITSCNKDNNSNNSGIIIKGKISASNMKGTATKAGPSLSLTDATKVYSVNINNGSLISEYIDIKDGSFAATAGIGTATALIFLDADSKYIGTLSTRGLNLLPLSNLEEGENTMIDLANLTLSGTTITASHDPFGNEIIISDAEINRLKELDGFFELIAKNLDANNDGILDATVDKQLFIKTRFWVQANHWGINAAPLMSDINLHSLGYSIELNGAKGFLKPASIVLSGPLGNPYNDISTAFINSNGDGGFYSGISRSGGLFAKGTYSINIDGYTCSLEYSNNEVQNQVLILPTLHTGSDGKLASISLEYKLPDGNTIDPINILTDVMIQFNDDSENQYYDSPRLKNEGASLEHCNCVHGVFSYTPDKPVDISHLNKITIAYNDLLGNTYFINWNK
jgi:hypothetical protein